MSENATVKTMVNSVLENQKLTCEKMAEVLSSCGNTLGSGDLEALANSMTMMAAARRNIELMAQAAQKAQEGTAENPEVVNGAAN